MHVRRGVKRKKRWARHAGQDAASVRKPASPTRKYRRCSRESHVLRAKPHNPGAAARANRSSSRKTRTTRRSRLRARHAARPAFRLVKLRDDPTAPGVAAAATRPTSGASSSVAEAIEEKVGDDQVVTLRLRVAAIRGRQALEMRPRQIASVLHASTRCAGAQPTISPLLST